ncbi:hypothetical protein HYT23_06520 [Candidatus Pacearchaeota archaeon]|nr:hypothetical protein [Candidatus Pacearchaeota archaeon]
MDYLQLKEIIKKCKMAKKYLLKEEINSEKSLMPVKNKFNQLNIDNYKIFNLGEI